MTGASGSVVETRAFSLASAFFCIHHRQDAYTAPPSRAGARGPGGSVLLAHGRPVPAPFVAPGSPHPRVACHFIPQALYLGLGLLQASLQGRAASERSRPRTGPHAYAILGHPVEIDQVLLHQGGHTVSKQLIQKIEVRNAKVSQG